MAEPQTKRHRPLHCSVLVGIGDQAIYVLVAIMFLAAAAAMGVYSVVNFVENVTGDFPLDVIAFVEDLLLVLIILEVLGTVRSYLERGSTSLRPFLYIGIISATRRILAIGAETTIGHGATETQFRHLMIDLGINGLVVLALALALYLFDRHRGADDAESTSVSHDPLVLRRVFNTHRRAAGI